MEEGQNHSNNLLDTTDCLEAIGVLRQCKNLLFIIIFICLLLSQAIFWLVNTGYVKPGQNTETKTTTIVVEETTIIDQAAKQVATEPKQPVEAKTQEPVSPKKTILKFPVKLKFEQLANILRVINFALVITAALYCLTLLFCFKVSLLGRLGGINHICRAFFLSLALTVLLFPWQKLFPGIVAGAIYTPQRLLDACQKAEHADIFGTGFHYLRFTGYWLLVFLILIFSQIRSARWSKAILHRLEII